METDASTYNVLGVQWCIRSLISPKSASQDTIFWEDRWIWKSRNDLVWLVHDDQSGNVQESTSQCDHHHRDEQCLMDDSLVRNLIWVVVISSKSSLEFPTTIFRCVLPIMAASHKPPKCSGTFKTWGMRYVHREEVNGNYWKVYGRVANGWKRSLSRNEWLVS